MTDAPQTELAEAEARFLDGLRGRVAWQAERAAELRREAAVQHYTFDVLDPKSLAALVATRPDDVRGPEWRAFLAELDDLIEDDGRLPASLEGLVRLVFAELL